MFMHLKSHELYRIWDLGIKDLNSTVNRLSKESMNFNDDCLFMAVQSFMKFIHLINHYILNIEILRVYAKQRGSDSNSK